MWIERERLEKQMVQLVGGCQDRWDKEKVVMILDVACIDGRLGRSLEPQKGCGQEDLCNPQILKHSKVCTSSMPYTSNKRRWRRM